MHCLTDIPFAPDLPWLLKRLRVKPGSAAERELLAMLAQAQSIARPKALYLPVYVTARGADWLELDGVRLESRVLAVNLKDVQRAFPYLATCGVELQEWAASMDDALNNFWAEAVKEAALFCALRALGEDLDERYRPGKSASMSPGSLADWPIEQQKPLFTLLDSGAAIGVQLTEDCLMLPTKTVSGLRFTTESDFESCQLCSRDGCPGRRAVYEPDLYDSRYCQQNQPGVEQTPGSAHA